MGEKEALFDDGFRSTEAALPSKYMRHKGLGRGFGAEGDTGAEEGSLLLDLVIMFQTPLRTLLPEENQLPAVPGRESASILTLA